MRFAGKKRSILSLTLFLMAAAMVVVFLVLTVGSGGDGKVENAARVITGWRMLGGNEGHTFFLDASLGLQLERSWKRRLDGTAAGAAAITGGKAFISLRSGWVYCLDLESGKPLWRYDVGSSVESMPAVEGDCVLIGATDGKLVCLNGEGKERWTREVGGAIRSAPTPVGGSVFTGSSDGHVYCFSLSKGRLLWSSGIGAAVEWSPAVAGDQVFAVSREGLLVALDSSSGEIVWQFESRDFPVAAPVVGNGKVFLVGEVSVSTLDVQSGRLLWRKDFPGDLQATPALLGDMLILLLGDRESADLIGLDITTGDASWRSVLDVNPPCGIICAGSKVFLADGRGLRAAEIGSSAWIELLRVNGLAGNAFSAFGEGFIVATESKNWFFYRFK